MGLMYLVIVVLVLITAGIITGFRSMRIPRELDREKPEDDEAFRAYARSSRWPIFIFGRYIVLQALAKSQPQGWLFDMGCGPGFLTAQISRRYRYLKVAGLDISQTTLNIARQLWEKADYCNLEFLAGDVQHLPLENNSLNLVISSLSLHHWPDARLALVEILRTLKPGGSILIFDLRRDSPAYFYWALKIGQPIFAPRAIRRTNGAVGSFWAAYRPEEVMKMLEGSGFGNVNIERHFGWMIIRGNKPPNPEFQGDLRK